MPARTSPKTIAMTPPNTLRMEARARAPEQRPPQNRHERLRPAPRLADPVERLPVRPALAGLHPVGRRRAKPRCQASCSTVRLTHSRSGRSGEVWPFDLDANVSLRGIGYAMKREREMKRERDELDSLAAEAGQSAFLVGMTALILVTALVLGFAV
jgi:hypothetical protein